MSQAASAAAAFYRDVAKHRTVWTIRDAGGLPAPMTSSGKRAMPFWSTESRALKLIKAAPAYAGFTPEAISWESFVDSWLPELDSDDMVVGVNWSGPRAVGYDLTAADLRRNIEAVMARPRRD